MEQLEIGLYEHYVQQVRSIDPADFDEVEQLLNQIAASAETDRISRDMHEALCGILVQRIVERPSTQGPTPL